MIAQMGKSDALNLLLDDHLWCHAIVLLFCFYHSIILNKMEQFTQEGQCHYKVDTMLVYTSKKG